jgi:peptide/nickel transport system permease protein
MTTLQSPVDVMPVAASDLDATGPSRHRGLRRFVGNPVAMAAVAFLVLLTIVAVFAPVFAPHDPNDQDLTAVLSHPGDDGYILGTDQFGRDQLSRLIYGARISLVAGLVATVVSAAIGIPTGLAAGFMGGKVDTALSRFNEALIALPGLLLLFLVITIFGPDLINIMVAIGFLGSTGLFRIVRASAQDVAAETYIEAMHAVGAGKPRIVFRHVLPNITSPVLVRLSLGVGGAIVAESSLSFLGFGVVPPTASWGGMLADGNSVLSQAPYLVYAPGAMIALSVLAFSLIGDGMRAATGTSRAAVRGRS